MTTPHSKTKSKRGRGSSLSLSMIVKNEEKFLPDCLESVKSIVDEIVIVDTGSTDATKVIAARYGARIFDFEWIGDFSAARNYSLERCTGDWVLYLDADERLTGGQVELLRKLISAGGVGAYNVLIENPHSLRQGNFNQENTYPRLFRRLPGVKFEGKVHEQVWPSLMRLKLAVKRSPLVIHHLGYGQGYDVVKQKAERNLELLKNQLTAECDDAYTQFQIGNTLVVLQRYAEAGPVLELALKNGKLDVTNRASCYNLLAEIEVKRGNIAGAVELCRESLQLAPKQLMAHWFLSLMYFDLKVYAKAIEQLKSIEYLLRIPGAQRSNQIASDLHLRREDVMKRMAMTYMAAGEFKNALIQYANIVELTQAKEGVVELLECAGQVEDARFVIDQFKHLAKANPNSSELLLPLAWHYRKLNDLDSAIHFIDKTLLAQPANSKAYGFAVRWKIEAGDVHSAERTLELAEENGVRDFELHKAGLQLSLQKGNVNAAFRHLELMSQTTDADLSPIKNRLVALTERMSAATSP
ncbi:MAG: glycosyltransferase [Bacteroidetes bacterium]|nr:glycosyltransferase [Bacteroidota bacterium]MCW5895136.1 glycosyltransferase [Bacteroidota bacterium]